MLGHLQCTGNWRELPAFSGLPFNTDQYRNELKEIKKCGYALSVADCMPDVCVLAASIYVQNQTVIGALEEKGFPCLQSSKIFASRMDYFDTMKVLRMILEVAYENPARKRPDPLYVYPTPE